MKSESLLSESMLCWELPAPLILHAISFVAPPTYRAGIICNTLALLCKDAHQALLQNESLWEIVLREDYNTAGAVKRHRRTSKRRKQSYRQQVEAAHRIIYVNTEVAFYHVSEWSKGHPRQSKLCLSLAKLRRLLNKVAPLRINAKSSTGGTLLVEVCRARHVSEGKILACVRELVLQHGASVNTTTYESPHSYETPLCVAATRGMPRVVEFLLSQNADTTILCAGRFRLQAFSSRTTTRRDVTALAFAIDVYHCETKLGAQDLRSLGECIDALRRHKSESTRTTGRDSLSEEYEWHDFQK